MDASTAAVTATTITGPYFLEILKMFLDLGPIGLITVIWWVDKRKIDEILGQYNANMQEHRENYKANVSLVNKYEDLAGDLKDVITLNTQTMTQLVDRIDKEVCK